jgi:hypothetical protein
MGECDPPGDHGELGVFLTREQAERLLDDPETELVIYYPNGTRIIVRISDEYVDENKTVH